MTPATRTKRRIAVAVRGVGPAWPRWAAAAERFGERMRIAAVSDASVALRDAAAAKIKTFAAPGLESIVSIAPVDGVIVCDGGVAGAVAASRLAGRVGAVLWAEPPWADPVAVEMVRNRPRGRGEVLVAATARFTPAVQRLKELIATRLGPPRSIAVGAGVDTAEAVDLVRYLTEDAFAEASVRSRAGVGITWGDVEPADAVEVTTVRVFGRTGDAEAFDDISVRWQSGGDVLTEQLDAERPAEVAVLDLFLRRAAGGLIPMPTGRDFVEAVEVARRLGR